jgi:periplasmic protein TonB
MKKFLLLISLVSSCLHSFPQNADLKNTNAKTVAISMDTTSEPVYLIVDQNASFQGGDLNTFRDYIQKSIIYPKKAARKGIEGRIIVEFKINSKGVLVDPLILRGVHPLLDNEVLRCLNNSPAWTPGIKDGKAVKQQFVLPVIFKLE